MKKILFILFLGVMLGSDLCGQIRVPADGLTVKGIDGEIVHFYNGKPFNGICYIEYKNQKIFSETTYKDGIQNGIDKCWYKNGQLMYEKTYKDGYEEGLYRNWYKNGQLKFEYNYERGILIGSYKEWSKNGKLKESFEN